MDYLKLFNEDKMQIVGIDLVNGNTEFLVDIHPTFKLNEVLDISEEEAEKINLMFNVHILPKSKGGWIEGEDLNGDMDEFYADPSSPLYELTPLDLDDELYNTIIEEMKHWNCPVGYDTVMIAVDMLEPRP